LALFLHKEKVGQKNMELVNLQVDRLKESCDAISPGFRHCPLVISSGLHGSHEYHMRFKKILYRHLCFHGEPITCYWLTHWLNIMGSTLADRI